MTQEETKLLRVVAKQSHDNYWGEVQKDDPVDVIEFKRGYTSGYINAIDELVKLLDLDLSLIIRKLKQ
jgi:hypothetical protein